MKNLILILAIIFCSCKKHHEDPISGYASLHIEYSASRPSFANPGFQSKVMILFPDRSPLQYYSSLDKANVISQDVILQGNQKVIINGFVIDSVGCGSSQSNVPVAMKLTYNGKVISDKSASGGCNGSIQYNGTLEFIH